MPSGRGYLQSLDRALDGLRLDFRKLDTELQDLTRGMATLRRRESEAYRELARLRLADIEDDGLAQALDAADREAQALLEERENALANLGNELDALQGELDALAGQRSDNADALAGAERELADRLTAVADELAKNAEFVALTERSQQLVNQAAGAEEKTARAEQDRREKGKPYEADPLFRYLWDRGYGTSAYRAWPLSRLIDRMMARHIRFEHARRNYYSLTEIPRRLRRHTERLEAAAAASLNELAELERSAEVAAGVETLEEAVAAATAICQSTDAAIDAADERYRNLLNERERFANGQDAYFGRAMQALVESFKAEPIPALQREAELTATETDDRLVRDLASYRDEVAELNRYLADKHEVHGRRMNRMNELTAVRSQFKRKHFDALDSVIDDRGNAELMLAEFLQGLISGDRLWRVIRHSQRFRPRMRRSGSGNIGSVRVPRMPRSVRLPRGMGGSGGFKVPRMPGGGFRTKGGF
ncbi:MAG: hypothetical protein AAFX44_15775 [Pseudomonadota bacterium]